MIASTQQGFTTLLAVMIISAIMITISIGVPLRSLDELKMSYGEQESARALNMANLCAEQALMKLLAVLNYAGSETVTVGSYSCDILAISGSGNTNRTIQAQSTVSGYTAKVEVNVSQLSPIMEISSWEVVSDF